MCCLCFFFFFFFKQKTAYEMRISDWSSDVCSSDLEAEHIDARIAHVTEIEAQITIAQKIAPIGGGYALDDMLRAVLVDLEQPDWRPPFVVAIEFDRRNLRLARYIAQLRMSEDRKSTRLNSSH